MESGSQAPLSLLSLDAAASFTNLPPPPPPPPYLSRRQLSRTDWHIHREVVFDNLLLSPLLSAHLQPSSTSALNHFAVAVNSQYSASSGIQPVAAPTSTAFLTFHRPIQLATIVRPAPIHQHHQVYQLNLTNISLSSHPSPPLQDHLSSLRIRQRRASSSLPLPSTHHQQHMSPHTSSPFVSR